MSSGIGSGGGIGAGSGNILPPKAQMVMARDFVVRRSELTVPGHSMKMMAKAATSNADQVMLDLEDACRRLAKSRVA